MLLQLEQECLDIYCRKVEKTRKYRASLHQALAETEVEINNIISALGEHASFSRVCAFWRLVSSLSLQFLVNPISVLSVTLNVIFHI